MVEVPPMSACADFLSRVAAVAKSASSGRDAEPDSVFSAELAMDVEWGDESLPDPHGLAHAITGAFLYAGGERLETLGWCAAPEIPHVWSAAELARAAAEAASFAIWLGADLAPPERLQRLLALMAVSAAEEQGLKRLLGLSSVPPGITQGTLAWGERRRLRRAPFPNKTELLRLANPNTGRQDYKRLSAMAHGSVFALIGTWVEVVEAQESGNFASVQAHTWTMCLSAAYYTLTACVQRRALKGRELTKYQTSWRNSPRWGRRSTERL